MGRIVGENKHKGTLYPVDSKAIYRIIYEVVSVLPTENIKTSVIYCVPIIGKDNEYNMYLYIDGWVNVGSGSIDLSDYYTKEEVDSIVADISTLSFKIVQQKPIEDIETNIIYLIPKSESSAGNVYEEWIYIDNKWELLGTTDIDLSNYMTLAPLNPTAEHIAAMPRGQLYSDNVNHKGVVKGVQEFYDAIFVDAALENKQKKIQHLDMLYRFSTDEPLLSVGSFVEYQGNIYCLNQIVQPPYQTFYKYVYTWWRAPFVVYRDISIPPEKEECVQSDTYFRHPSFFINDVLITNDNSIYICTANYELISGGYSRFYMYEWEKIYSAYTKTEIDTMIGDIETALSEV